MMGTNPSAWKPTFIPMEGKKYGGPSQDLAVIRVVSYNILAQVYVKSVLFPHSPSPCLRWKARSQAILERLLSLKADILCLQELDEFESFYKGQLDNYGYSSIYVKRSGKKRDGCGIFFRRERVELVSDEPIYYNDLVPNVEEIGGEEAHASESTASSNEENISGEMKTEDRGDPNDPRIRLKRDCVGIMAAFRVSDAPDKLIVLVNTHLYWDPDWADVKLAQAKYLVSCTLKFQIMLEKKFQFKSPVIICGDFNSMPGDQVYTYLTSGGGSGENLISYPLAEVQSSVGKDEAKMTSHLGGKSCQAILNNEVVERCPLPLYSLYGLLRGEPTFTNCTPEFTGTLDYIFFSSLDHLRPMSLLELSSPASFDVLGGLPNYSHPSDHLPIGTDFAIIDRI